MKRFLSLFAALTLTANAAGPTCLSVQSQYKTDNSVHPLIQTLAGNITNIQISNEPSFTKVDLLFRTTVEYMNGTSVVTAQQWDIGVYNSHNMSDTATTCGSNIKSIKIELWIFESGSIYSRSYGFAQIKIP